MHHTGCENRVYFLKHIYYMAFFSRTRNMHLIVLLLLSEQTDQKRLIRIEKTKNYNYTSFNGFFCRDRLVSCSSRIKGEGTNVPFENRFIHYATDQKLTNHRARND